MNKISRFYRCPMNGEAPNKDNCRTCPSGKIRGPSTGEKDIFPIDVLFCDFDSLTGASQ